MRKYITKWKLLSLSTKFLLAGGVVMLMAMLFVGSWVSKRIEDAVVYNSASTVALYMESFIAPLSQELVTSDKLSDTSRMELAKIFTGTNVGKRVVSVKIWKENGLVVYASNEDIEGEIFTPSEELKDAWSGQISATFEDLSGHESENEALLGVPLLEVYSPITERWTGKTIAVVEFYERAETLKVALRNARWSSWMVIGLSFLISGLLLFRIVQAGGHIIQQQQNMLMVQLDNSRNIARQNESLKQRVVNASGRATAQADRSLRQIGSELHDGPAQYISLAALRLDTIIPATKSGVEEAANIRRALNKALVEIRSISRGLAVPDLDNVDVYSIIKRTINDHNRLNNQAVKLPEKAHKECVLGYTANLCVFRFIQEGLSNALKYAASSKVIIAYEITNNYLVLTIIDYGAGFNIADALTVREDGGQGLIGLRDRAESIAGNVDIRSAKNVGTRLTLSLPIQRG